MWSENTSEAVPMQILSLLTVPFFFSLLTRILLFVLYYVYSSSQKNPYHDFMILNSECASALASAIRLLTSAVPGQQATGSGSCPQQSLRWSEVPVVLIIVAAGLGKCLEIQLLMRYKIPEPQICARENCEMVSGSVQFTAAKKTLELPKPVHPKCIPVRAAPGH